MPERRPVAAEDLGSLTIVGAGRAGTSLALALASRPGAGVVHVICRNDARRAELQRWCAQLPLQVLATPSPGALAVPLVIFATADRDLHAAAATWQAALPPRGATPLGAGALGAGALRAGPRSTGPSDRPSQTWLHLSGVADPGVLRVTGHVGAIGSCHPLAAIPDPLDAVLRGQKPPISAAAQLAMAARAARPLRGAFFALAGDPDAITQARRVALSVQGDPHVVAVASRAAYHGAASVVANDLVALLAIGERLCQQAGLPVAAARPALLHLARTALDAVETASAAPHASLAQGLTGAVGRGDADTLVAHLHALAETPDAAEAHRRLSRVLLALVGSAGGLDPERVEAVRQALD